jgi:hypothetical protein
MNVSNEVLDKVLQTYGQLYYPELKLKVSCINYVDGRYYLLHSENTKVVSLMPPIKNESNIRKTD